MTTKPLNRSYGDALALQWNMGGKIWKTMAVLSFPAFAAAVFIWWINHKDDK